MPSPSVENAGPVAPVDRARVEAVLSSLASRLPAAARSVPGQILFRLTGPDVDFAIRTDDDGARLAPPDRDPAGPPLIEVVGDAATVCAVLTGERDARRQFFEGGFRVRGNLRHMSDLALELGLISTPL
ncbi:hypothetical protein [Streptomyces sp. NPDC014894]|uniref:hypothetical protein n=1 Tax=unclassified Streptomyces TaxID=2593676 RepID=UPI003700CA16